MLIWKLKPVHFTKGWGLLLVALVAALAFTWWTAARIDREMRDSLLQQTQLVAKSINIQSIKALSGTQTDLNSLDYLRLKEQLTAVRSANPRCRFLYLMGRRDDGTVFMSLDNEPVGSTDCSPPGEDYPEASADCRQVFDTNIGCVEGPTADRWGTWVSSLVPLADPQTGAVVAVLGMDIDARDWKVDVAARTALPVGIPLVLLVGVVAVWAAIHSQQRALRESEGHYRGLFEHMAEGYAHCRMIFKDGEPQDFIYLAVNTAFETLTGLRNVTGKRVSEAIPGIRESSPQLFSTYARVSLTGKPEKFEMFVEALNIWFSISVYSVEKECFVAVFDVITERKKAEENLRVEQENLKAIFAAAPVGMLLFDEDSVIVDSNAAISRMVSRGPRQIHGHRCGGGLGCAQSLKGESGCGSAPACTLCHLGKAIREVLISGNTVHHAEIPYSLLTDHPEQPRWLSVNAEPVLLKGHKHVLVAIDDITPRKAVEAELRTAARTDRLTGLPNRALLLDRLQQAVLRSKRLNDYHFAVAFIDFDRFKIVNDSFGHGVGDLLLQEVGRRLQATIRSNDSLSRGAREHSTARLGGDEFVVLLDGIATPEDGKVVANRLLEVFAEPYQLGAHKVYSTASIGIVTSGMAANSAEEVLRDADTAMYEAKLAGRGQYAVFDASMRQRVLNRLHLENDLRKAMEAGQLFLMYQPIVSLHTGQVESFESLVRWKHPERGLVSPSEFIPIAEDTDLIVRIGEWVLREACNQFARWQKCMGAAAPRNISVNLSRRQLALPDLPNTIRRILEETGVAPSCLHLEVTESAVMKDAVVATEMLLAIKAIGVKLDMDDFGTGYSSLACLHQFPLDVLKIDRSFIANINRGRDFAALVHAVTQLARNLKISVVAEGIETVEQLLMLQSLDCEFGQGYLFSKPLTLDQVPDFRMLPRVLPGQAA